VNVLAGKTLVSLSFDDGREDTYRTTYQVMKRYGFRGTIHVVTGYVDGTWMPEKWCTAKGAITVEQLKEMKDYGFEISSHGDKHITEKHDLLESIRKLRNWGLVEEDVGFSIPNSQLSEQIRKEFTEDLVNHGVAYMRGGRNPLSYSLKSKVFYGLYTISKLQWFYDLFNRHNWIDLHKNCSLNKYDLFSVVIRYEDHPGMIAKFIKSHFNKSNWVILMIHGIQEKNEDTYGKDPWCWDLNKFEQLCKHLKLMSDVGEISVRPILEVIKEEIWLGGR